MDMTQMFRPLVEDHAIFAQYDTVPLDADSSDLSNTLRAARMLLLQCGGGAPSVMHLVALSDFYQSKLAPFAAFEKCRQRRELQSTVLELLCTLEEKRMQLEEEEGASSPPIDSAETPASTSTSIWNVFDWHQNCSLWNEKLPLPTRAGPTSSSYLSVLLTAKEFDSMNHADLSERVRVWLYCSRRSHRSNLPTPALPLQMVRCCERMIGGQLLLEAVVTLTKVGGRKRCLFLWRMLVDVLHAMAAHNASPFVDAESCATAADIAKAIASHISSVLLPTLEYRDRPKESAARTYHAQRERLCAIPLPSILERYSVDQQAILLTPFLSERKRHHHQHDDNDDNDDAAQEDFAFALAAQMTKPSAVPATGTATGSEGQTPAVRLRSNLATFLSQYILTPAISVFGQPVSMPTATNSALE